MNVMQEALIQACKNLSIPYEILHKDQIIVRVHINDQLYHYIHWLLPFNRFDVSRILRDKDLQYSLLHNVIRIPKWISYLDPSIEEKYSVEIANRFGDIEHIAEDIIEQFNVPVLLKPNMKSQGANVIVCHSEREIVGALEEIFTKSSRYYSYIAVAQQVIPIKHEYRVLGFKGKNVLTYEKSIDNAIFTGNVSPLHWEGGKAKQILDRQVIDRIERFIKPVFKEIELVFGGFDIVEDENGALWLLEINRMPGVGIFVRDNGIEPIVRMHEDILKELL